MNIYKVTIEQVDELFGDFYYYCVIVKAENEQEAFEEAKKTKTYRSNKSSAIIRIDKLLSRNNHEVS